MKSTWSEISSLYLLPFGLQLVSKFLCQYYKSYLSNFKLPLCLCSTFVVRLLSLCSTFVVQHLSLCSTFVSSPGKVFKKLDFNVPGNIVNGIIMCKPGVIEIVLHNLRVKVLLVLPFQRTSVKFAKIIFLKFFFYSIFFCPNVYVWKKTER